MRFLSSRRTHWLSGGSVPARTQAARRPRALTLPPCPSSVLPPGAERAPVQDGAPPSRGQGQGPWPSLSPPQGSVCLGRVKSEPPRFLLGWAHALRVPLPAAALPCADRHDACSQAEGPALKPAGWAAAPPQSPLGPGTLAPRPSPLTHTGLKFSSVWPDTYALDAVPPQSKHAKLRAAGCVGFVDPLPGYR